MLIDTPRSTRCTTTATTGTTIGTYFRRVAHQWMAYHVPQPIVQRSSSSIDERNTKMILHHHWTLGWQCRDNDAWKLIKHSMVQPFEITVPSQYSWSQRHGRRREWRCSGWHWTVACVVAATVRAIRNGVIVIGVVSFSPFFTVFTFASCLTPF